MAGNVWVDSTFGDEVSDEKGKRTTWRRRFVADGIEGFDADLRAYALIRSFIAQRYPIFTSQRIQRLQVKEDEGGGGVWRGECTFASPTAKQLLDEAKLPGYSFSTKGGTAHITNSRKTIKVYPGFHPEFEYKEVQKKDSKESTTTRKTLQAKRNGEGKIIVAREIAPNFRGGINWNPENGTFDGVDITAPSWRSTLQLSVPNEYVDPQFRRMLRWITGTVNAVPFDGFQPGECLFVGCDGERRVQQREKQADSGGEDENEDGFRDFELIWDLTFEFWGSPNTKKWIEGIGYVEKRGWDYVHILRRPVEYRLEDFEIPGTPADSDPMRTADPNQQANIAPDPESAGDEEETAETLSVSHPVAAYVEQVYPYADFRVLGIDL
ncbi:MAG TPA: hypothetical protein DEB39_16805 [Planctomycetaceae bacterium]|nr:hypothetical protein [Planctomycetaceae bacterium]